MQGLSSAPVSFDYTYTGVPSKDTARATTQTSDDAEAHNTRGITYSENGDQDRAIAEFSRAIALKPDFAYAYYNRGFTHEVKGEYDRAIVDYTKAIELKPNFVEAYNNRGAAYGNRGNYDRAIRDFNKATELKPNDVNAYNNRGAAYRKKGNYDRAIEDYNTAIKLNSSDANAYYNRGILCYERGSYDCAIEDFGKAIELNLNDVNAYNYRGAAYCNIGELDHAIENFNKAIELNLNDSNAYNNRGVAYYKKGDYDCAIRDFNKAIELNSSDANAYYNRGEAWLYLGEWNKARADLTTARNMGIDIIAAFHNDYKNVLDFEGRNGVKLPENIAVMLTSQVTAMENKEAWEVAHELAGDAEIGLDELLENYAQAWKTLTKAPQPEGSAVHADLGDLAPKDIEQALQKVRAEAEEERRLDQELDAIPETAYEDVDRFLKTVNKFVPLPDIMPLDNGEICLEWRAGQKIFTLSFGGDGHIVFAGIFGAAHQACGILTFSMPHLIAVIGMITGLYLHYDN